MGESFVDTENLNCPGRQEICQAVVDSMCQTDGETDTSAPMVSMRFGWGPKKINATKDYYATFYLNERDTLQLILDLSSALREAQEKHGSELL